MTLSKSIGAAVLFLLAFGSGLPLNSPLVTRDATSNIGQGRCNWVLHKDNSANYLQLLAQFRAWNGLLGSTIQAHQLILCDDNGSGLCAWTDRDRVDGKTIKAAAALLGSDANIGSCGSAALDGPNGDLAHGQLTFNYPSKCHNADTGDQYTDGSCTTSGARMIVDDSSGS